MKKLFTLLAAALISSAAIATPITPEQAMSRISSSTPGARFASTPMQLVYTARETAVPAYYVFNAGNGFLIAAADDMAQAVLGYSDNGNFDYNTIPDNMREWLKIYAEEIAYARTLPATDPTNTIRTERPVRTPISSMVHTRWNQGDPYNALCPVYNGERTVTGCVATAMAQVLRFWKYPTTGTGSHSYTYNNVTNSFDFGGTTFDWAHMTYTYGATSTQTEKDAVATLMRACGVSVDMMYNISSVGGSGAYSNDVPGALITYFGYAPSAVFYNRASFGLYEWEDMIYGSLKDGCPLYYSGRGTAGGHAFVCDGYEGDGYFHFNWGWGGSSDGYFLLTALNPTSLGIGGGGGGFNMGQGAILNLKPNYPGAKRTYIINYTDPFTISYSSNRLTLSGLGYNSSAFNIPQVNFGMRLTAEDGKADIVVKGTATATDLKPLYGYSSFSATITPATMADGTYSIRPVYTVTENGESTTYNSLIPPSMIGKYKIQISNGVATLKTRTDATIKANDFAFTTPLFYGNNFGFKVNYVNPSDAESYREIYMGWFDASNNFLGVGDAMMTDLPGNETLPTEMVVAVPTKVKYSSSVTKSLSIGTPYKVALLIQTNSDASAPTYAAISDKIDATIQSAQTGNKLQANGITIENASSANANDMKFSVSVTATGGYYCQPIYYWVRTTSGTTLTSGSTNLLAVAPNETKTVDWRFTFPTAQKNTTYTLLLNARPNGTMTYLTQANFTVGTTGVTMVETDNTGFGIMLDGNKATASAPAPVTGIEVYSLQGSRQYAPVSVFGASADIDMSALNNGIYLVRINTLISSATLKVIKK